MIYSYKTSPGRKKHATTNHITDREKRIFYNAMTKCLRATSCYDYNYFFTSSCFIPYCKNESFKEEKESRLVFYTLSNDIGYDIPIKYYMSSGIIKPTIDVQFFPMDPSKNIVERFIVGPGQDQELIFNALIHMFDKKPFKYEETLSIDKSTNQLHKCENGIFIEKSKIPFRG